MAGQGYAAGLIAAAALAANAAAAGDPSFETVFDAKGEPAHLHYRARYVAAGAVHQIEVWRDAGSKVKRVTDGAVETYAVRKPGDADFEMDVLDRKRRIDTRIDRTNMYRLGAYSDWFDLTHGLRHPRGAYRLIATAAPANASRPLEPCAWHALTQGPRVTKVCWSAVSRLPMLMMASTGVTIWKVVEVDQKPIPANTFRIDAKGFVHVDANQDISRD